MNQQAIGAFLSELRAQTGLTQEQLANSESCDFIAGVGFGVASGMLVVGAIFTSRYAGRIREAKIRLLGRTTSG